MNWPPMLLHLRFPIQNGTWGIWLPFFLVYPILLVVSLLVLPFLLLAAIFLCFDSRIKIPLLILPYFWNVVFKTRGLLVDVQHAGRDVLIYFI